jgi:hypothetical protein
MSGKECGCVERTADEWTGLRMSRFNEGEWIESGKVELEKWEGMRLISKE